MIGRKIAATFNSTGIASFFLHPAEALHGDLGVMRPDDLLLLISKSGQLQELETIIPALESDQHSLDEALALFERGQALARRCADLLDRAELKIQQLSGDRPD